MQEQWGQRYEYVLAIERELPTESRLIENLPWLYSWWIAALLSILTAIYIQQELLLKLWDASDTAWISGKNAAIAAVDLTLHDITTYSVTYSKVSNYTY